jgi:Plant transposon protein
MTIALRQLCYRLPADGPIAEYCRTNESTNNECLKRFSSAVADLFEDEWLRLWTMEEALESSRHYEQLGFPGCLGAVDCASWVWEACPMAYQGMCKGKDRKPTVRMEVITDDFLRIYWLNFGIPGSKNDIQIVNQSPFFNRIRSGRWPPACTTLNICGFALKTFYFLADGYIRASDSFALPSRPQQRPRKKHFVCNRKARARPRRGYLLSYSNSSPSCTARQGFET